LQGSAERRYGNAALQHRCAKKMRLSRPECRKNSDKADEVAGGLA
jgi:hypothetical protein